MMLHLERGQTAQFDINLMAIADLLQQLQRLLYLIHLLVFLLTPSQLSLLIIFLCIEILRGL